MIRDRSLDAASVTRGARVAAWWALVVILLLSAAACERGPSGAEEARLKNELGQVEMTRLRAAHSLADRAQTSAQRDTALTALRAELGQIPPGPALELDWLRQDLFARISGLELLQGRADAALAAAERGLAVSASASLPLSNLYIAKGRSLEQLGRKANAGEAYYRALLVNEQLMKDALEDP